MNYLASISTGSTSTDSTNSGSKIFRKKSYMVADVYDVVRPKMVASILNM